MGKDRAEWCFFLGKTRSWVLQGLFWGVLLRQEKNGIRMWFLENVIVLSIEKSNFSRAVLAFRCFVESAECRALLVLRCFGLWFED